MVAKLVVGKSVLTSLKIISTLGCPRLVARILSTASRCGVTRKPCSFNLWIILFRRSWGSATEHYLSYGPYSAAPTICLLKEIWFLIKNDYSFIGYDSMINVSMPNFFPARRHDRTVQYLCFCRCSLPFGVFRYIICPY